MSLEQKVLFFAVVLGIFQLFFAASAATKQRGLKWNMGTREPVAPLTGYPGRIDRAFQNFKETFPFFLAAVCLLSLTHKGGSISHAGSLIYLLSRVVYIPLYVFGVAVVRSVVWMLSLLGILLVLAQLFVQA
jgi:uncharacterized MAPEG superfamily protein